MTRNHHEAELPETPFDEATDLVGPEEDVPEPSGRRFVLPSWKPLIFILAVMLAPVFGLAFGLDFALGVLVVAMAFTTWMAWEGSRELPHDEGSSLRRAAMLNGALALAVLALLIGRQFV
ncbi:MAG TPA: hypothetical protein VGR29_02525 [Thermomicrobiales bacterium]|nr:hypothetical protein [Thermomicrobiales bacterium]